MNDITCGVPQGSILGPLLFIIYINDLNDLCKNASLVLFADDTNIFFSSDNLQQLQKTVCHELSIFCDWFACNKLSLNLAKTNYIVFNNSSCTRDKTFNIVVNGQTLQRVNNTKFLGVIVDSKLSWVDHISYISSQVAKGVNIIGRLKYIVPKNVLRMIYLSLIYPHLTYCSSIWSCASSCHIQRLFILQKRAVRHISMVGSRDPTSPICKSLYLLKLHDILNLGVLCFTYRFLGNLLPNNFSNFLEQNRLKHGYDTRHAHLLRNPLTLSRFSQRSLRYRAVRVWNSLPDTMISRPSLHSFRKNVVRYYISKY